MPREQVARKGEVTSPWGEADRERTQGQCPEEKQNKGHFRRKVTGEPQWETTGANLVIAGIYQAQLNRWQGLPAAGSLALRARCHSYLKWVWIEKASNEPSGMDQERSTWLNQGHESSWQITAWFVSISELGKCLSLKESIPGGKRDIFLGTSGWVIYFKWLESLFMSVPPQIQWTVYLHEARKCCHFF